MEDSLMSEQEQDLLRSLINDLSDTEELLNGSFVVEGGIIVFKRWSDNAIVPMTEVVAGLS